MKTLSEISFHCKVPVMGLLVLTGLATVVSSEQMGPLDILIVNASVLDGSGSPPFEATIGIRHGRIVSVDKGPDSAATKAGQVIDAAGLIVAPGFIDVHMHVEGSLPRHPDAGNLVRDGVTTIVTGNCGASANDLGKWFADLEEKGIGVNAASLVGHNTVRRQVLGRENRAPTDDELQQMLALVEKAMADGAVGLSTGLLYIPGAYAETEEVIALAKVAARQGGVYATHMRDETSGIFDSLEESFRIGREADMPVQISHFKIATKTMWGQSTKTLAAVEAARNEGLDVMLDQYPYTASSTRLDVLIPSWALAGGTDELRRRTGEPETRKKIIDQMLLREGRLAGWDHLGWAVVSNCPWDSSLNGKSIREINQSVYGREDTFEDQVNTVLDMASRDVVRMVYHMMSEEDVQAIMAHPLTMVGRDGRVYEPSERRPHPRSYGSAARVLGHYVREKKIIGLEEAIRKLATMPAERFGFTNRGMIKEGYWADIVIFDPSKVGDKATFDSPHQYSIGFRYVLVNGHLVVNEGEPTGARPGKVLRKN